MPCWGNCHVIKESTWDHCRLPYCSRCLSLYSTRRLSREDLQVLYKSLEKSDPELQQVIDPENPFDVQTLYHGHLLLSHIIAKFAIHKRIVLQVCSKLMQSARSVVRQALEILTPLCHNEWKMATQCSTLDQKDHS
ncbi:Transcription-associated protein 1 [Eumeta japonica]|uniref:Transcription-associated protein 1 n=1 Tax=Eumeta variegata TaxID=151549 RepID=A0A4C2A6H4_EUMVA|nr:Transcription-associated protein 1 [Eumeta japonica]